ncbi:MAG: nitroreductase family protein [Rhodobiaceae bacterium]
MSDLPTDLDTKMQQTGELQALHILETLAARASCRDFDGSCIDPEILQDIVRDGVQAPSSCNQQNWHFIIVSEDQRKLSACEISGGNHHFAECSALIYLCFQKGWTHGNFSIVQSVAGACYHMMLSAHLRGFQCIWNAGIGDQTRLRKMLALPLTFDVIGALAIGRAKPSAPDVKAPRRPMGEIFSWETFQRPSASRYPVKPADEYPYAEIRNDHNPFAEWDPAAWSWDQIADFRGYSVWAKSPLRGVYVSRRQGDAIDVEHTLLPAMKADSRIAEIMPWGGTSTVALLKRLPSEAHMSVAELSQHNISFIRERLSQEGHATNRVSFDLIENGRLPHATSTLDLVVLPQVIEHVPDPQALLDEVGRVLAPGGHVLVSVRNLDSAYGDLWRTTESRAQVPNQGPFTPVSAKAVAAWLSDRFEIEEDIGIGAEATGDAAILRGDARYSGRLYAARCRHSA